MGRRIAALLLLSTAVAVRGGIAHNHTLTVTDPNLGPIARRYLVGSSPPAWCTTPKSTPRPLVLGFHGQGHAPEDWGPAAGLSALGAQHGWAVVFPAGLQERIAGSSDSDVTWNCGTAGDDSTCLAGTNGSQCLESCSRLGLCGGGGGAGGGLTARIRSSGRCNWATCWDDAAFIDQLLTTLLSTLCYDPSQIFLVGESNGAMFIHYLLAKFPGRFLAAAPAFGLPLMGYLVGPNYELLRQRAVAVRHCCAAHRCS